MKKQIEHLLFTLYKPVIYRVEKFRATLMWFDGVRQAKKMHRELGGNRVYLLYDEKHGCWSPMTWRANKQLKPAFLVLRCMGKMRASKHIRTARGLEYYSFYYTRSKKNARSADSSNSVRKGKLNKWIDYYLYNLSEPMRKCLQYQRECRQQSRKPTNG